MHRESKEQVYIQPLSFLECTVRSVDAEDVLTSEDAGFLCLAVTALGSVVVSLP